MLGSRTQLSKFAHILVLWPKGLLVVESKQETKQLGQQAVLSIIWTCSSGNFLHLPGLVVALGLAQHIFDMAGPQGLVQVLGEWS